MSGIQIRVCGRYRLENVIQKRQKHTIYSATNVQTEQQIIIKAEESKGKKDNPQSLLQEGKIIQGLQGGIGIPSMHWCGQEEDYNFIVMEYLGKSLDNLFTRCQKRFTLKTVLMIGEQIIHILQYLHFKNFVHRQINPSNLLIGRGRKNSKLFLIDYSNTKRFRDPKTLEHLPYKQDSLNHVNLIFSSLNSHKGIQSSRRDDVESMLLMLIFFVKGLPWDSIEGVNLQTRSKAIFALKQTTSIQTLCEGLPKQFEAMMRHTRSLAFQDKPDYTYYKNVFKQKMNKEGILNDLIFDWVLLPIDKTYTSVEHYPLKIQIIPNEQQFIRNHLDILKREEETVSKNQKQVQPEPVVLTSAQEVRNQKQSKEKDCLLF